MAIARARLGKKSDEIIIPSSMSRFLGIAEGDMVEIEQTPEGIVIRPAKLPLQMRRKQEKK